MPKIPHSVRLWVVSIAAIIFIVVGTFVLVSYGQGYVFDLDTKKIHSSGLVLIDSTPNGAKVSIDGKSIGKQTPYRYTNARAGKINIELKKDTYRPWQSFETVIDGTVTFANYALLLPEILTQQSIDQPQSFYNIVQTSDHQKTLAVGGPQLAIYSISENSEVKKIYEPPIEQDLQNKVTSIEDLKLSEDGNKMMFKQRVANGTFQSIVAQTNNGKFDNLTQEYGFIFNDLRFNLNDSNELFWLDQGVLKKIRLNEHSISANLVNNIANLSVAKDHLVVVHTPVGTETTQKLSCYDLSGGDRKDILDLPPDSAGFQNSFIKSRYNDYITVLHNTSTNLQLIKDPFGQREVKDLGSKVNSIISSSNGRFLVLNQDSKMRTIDLEFSQDHNFGTNLDNLKNWSWYDDYHLIISQNQQLRIIDFDGQNNQLLTPIADVSAFGVQQSNKSILPLNSSGQVFRLWLIKK